MQPPILPLALAAFTLSCMPPGPPPEPGPAPDRQPEVVAEGEMVPAGYGTLVQDQVTLRVRKDNLLIKVTPLAEWVIRLTAPDTYGRLSGLAGTHGFRAARGRPDPSLFLVSFFSYQPDVRYEPEDLLLVNRGLRYRPMGIEAVTPGWGTQRLGQQETRMAVYAYEGGMELERDLVVEYQGLRNELWRDRMIPLLKAEETKVRARAGG